MNRLYVRRTNGSFTLYIYSAIKNTLQTFTDKVSVKMLALVEYFMNRGAIISNAANSLNGYLDLLLSVNL